MVAHPFGGGVFGLEDGAGCPVVVDEVDVDAVGADPGGGVGEARLTRPPLPVPRNSRGTGSVGGSLDEGLQTVSTQKASIQRA